MTSFISAGEVKLEIDNLHIEFYHMWRHLLLVKVMKNHKSLRTHANFYYQNNENVFHEFCRNFYLRLKVNKQNKVFVNCSDILIKLRQQKQKLFI